MALNADIALFDCGVLNTWFSRHMLALPTETFWWSDDEKKRYVEGLFLKVRHPLSINYQERHLYYVIWSPPRPTPTATKKHVETFCSASANKVRAILDFVSGAISINFDWTTKAITYSDIMNDPGLAHEKGMLLSTVFSIHESYARSEKEYHDGIAKNV